MNKDIKYIIDNFDFNRVLNVMNFLDWKYFDGPPTISVLKNLATELLEKLEKSKISEDNISSGGFYVAKHGDFLTLNFIIEESSNELILGE